MFMCKFHEDKGMAVVLFVKTIFTCHGRDSGLRSNKKRPVPAVPLEIKVNHGYLTKKLCFRDVLKSTFISKKKQKTIKTLPRCSNLSTFTINLGQM